MSYVKALIGVLITCATTLNAIPDSYVEALDPDRIYVNQEDVCQGIGDNMFYMHLGENMWVSTTRLIKDKTGLYTMSHNMTRHSSSSMEYVRHWKCPYCHHYWPEGVACQNPKCPSRY